MSDFLRCQLGLRVSSGSCAYLLAEANRNLLETRGRLRVCRQAYRQRAQSAMHVAFGLNIDVRQYHMRNSRAFAHGGKNAGSDVRALSGYQWKRTDGIGVKGRIDLLMQCQKVGFLCPENP